MEIVKHAQVLIAATTHLAQSTSVASNHHNVMAVDVSACASASTKKGVLSPWLSRCAIWSRLSRML
jgi:hypothetical protein